jgi:large subunit ribosomal protein L25
MTQIVLSGEPRTETGKGAARALRREGRIPAVVYGHSEPVHFSVSAREFHKTFHHISESMIFTVQVGKEKREVLIKDYVEDITTGKITHLDFFEIERGKKLRTHVEIELVGSSIGVREGGILDQSIHEVEIECFPKDIPEKIVVDVTELRKEQSVHVGELVVGAGVKILTGEDQTVVSVVIPRAEASEDDEEGADGAESIARETKED